MLPGQVPSSLPWQSGPTLGLEAGPQVTPGYPAVIEMMPQQEVM